MWYALARLAVTTWSAFCWGAGCGPTGQYQTYLSRVIERNALFANSLLFDLAAKLDLSGTTDFCIVSDVGTHFRNYCTLGSIANEMMTLLRMNIHYNFGLEAHFKNPCDMYFSTLTRRREDASLKVVIADVPDLKTVYEQEGKKRPSLAPAEFFYDFMPPPKKEVPQSKFVPSSLPVLITKCHSWTFRLADKRRRCLVNEHSVLTGTYVRAALIAGRRCEAHQTTLAAKLVDLAEAADEPDAALEDDGLDGEVLPITVETREQDGWRLSYKRLFPEFEKPEKAVKRLTRKREGMGFLMGLGAQGARRRGDAELKEASDRTARTRRQYAASVLAAPPKPAVEPVAAVAAVLGVYQVGGASGSGG